MRGPSFHTASVEYKRRPVCENENEDESHSRASAFSIQSVKGTNEGITEGIINPRLRLEPYEDLLNSVVERVKGVMGRWISTTTRNI